MDDLNRHSITYRVAIGARAGQKVFTLQTVAYVDGRQLTLRGDGGGKGRLSAPSVSADLFRLLGVQPVLGRDFVAADEAAGVAPVAEPWFWQRRFRGNADIIGQTLAEEVVLTVIGLTPEGFSLREHQDPWMPRPSTLAATDRSPSGFFVVARLADEVTVPQAQAELAAIARRLANEAHERPRARDLEAARPRRRMTRQMLVESALLAVAAGGGAWWLAKGSIATYGGRGVSSASR